MSQDGLLGTFEEQVLLAVVHADADAYGMTVRRQIEERTGRSVAIGAVYATLDRLETKGLVSSWLAEPDETRRGRPRRFFKLEPEGAVALEQAREAHASMWRGVELDSGAGKSRYETAATTARTARHGSPGGCST
jgi:PadR family transcriptional regulator PadR